MTQHSKTHIKIVTQMRYMTTLRLTVARLFGIGKVDKYILKDEHLSLKPTYKLAGIPNDIGEENFEELEITDTSKKFTEKPTRRTRLAH